MKHYRRSVDKISLTNKVIRCLLSFALFIPLLSLYIQQQNVFTAHAQTLSGTASVDIVDFMFSPATITVTAGTKVTWTNMSASGSFHTTTSNTQGTVNSWDSGLTNPDMAGYPSTFSFTFNNVGTYPYHCNVHTFMMGTVVVVAAGATTSPTPVPVATTAPVATTIPTSALTPTAAEINVPTVADISPTPIPAVTSTPGTTTTTSTSSLNSLLLSIIAIILQLIQSLFGSL